MSRGEGCLFLATHAGVRAAGVAARPLGNGARPACWPTYIATAWTAAWLGARGRSFVGPRELRFDDQWVMNPRWRDRRDEFHRANHRPTFVVQFDGRHISIELELTRQSKSRLEAAMAAHAMWVARGQSDAAMWVCSDKVAVGRIAQLGASAGRRIDRGVLRVELVDTLKAYALGVTAERAAAPHPGQVVAAA